MPHGVLPLWRFVVTDLAGVTLTILDHLASDRAVTPKLDQASEITFSVPSDSPYVNRLHTDGFPLIAEGVRQVYCFRRESNTPPYYTIRASGLILQVNDTASQGDGRTRVTAYDPWMYLNRIPCFLGEFSDPAKTGTLDLIDSRGALYTGFTAVDIIQDQFTTILAGALGGPPSASQGFFNITTFPACSSFGGNTYKIQQGTMLGDLLTDFCQQGFMDITFDPIWDPSGPLQGLLSEMVIHPETATLIGAGDYEYNAIFAWDRPGRSLVGVDDLFDGLGRADVIQFYEGQGGPPVALVSDEAAVDIYGEYWAQQFFPGQIASGAEALAVDQLFLRSRFKQTLTVNPAPERAPEPFIDYSIGSRVPLYISDGLRQELPEQESTGTMTQTVWQRIYELPIEIDDSGTETVRELVAGPVGPPP